MHYCLIHGLGQNFASWNKTILSLQKLNNIVCPDLWTLLNGKEINYTNLYQSFVKYCENISGDLNLCGLSLGGILALNYAIEYPDKVKSIVLIGTQYKIPKRLMKLQNFIFRFIPDTFFSKMGIKKNDVINLANSMLELDFSMKLKDVLCPALIVCGTKDTANKKSSIHLAKNIPNAEIKFIKDAGHELNIDVPEKLAVVLDTFW